jgi:hypothetical protein
VLHLMGAGPKGREGASDQRKGVISQVRFGESRLRLRTVRPVRQTGQDRRRGQLLSAGLGPCEAGCTKGER